MSVIVDIIVLAILALCIFLGYRRGLTGSILKIISFVLALVIAFALFKPVSSFIINNTDWDDNLEQSIHDIIVSSNGNVGETTSNDEGSGMPNVMVDYINKAIEEAGNNAKETIAEATSRDMAVTIINAGVWVALFIIARILLIFVKGLLKAITSLPLIKQVDKTGGIVYGILEALVIIYLVLAIVSFASPVVSQFGVITAIQNSFVGSMLYNNNLLLKLIF